MISIPNPCPQKISAMNRVGDGHYCGSCSKVIIDFRNKSNEEILNWIRNRQGEEICGTFLKSQVRVPSKPPFTLTRFVAALVLAFGSFLFTGCESEQKPKPKPEHLTGVILCEPPPLAPKDSLQNDTVGVVHLDSVR